VTSPAAGEVQGVFPRQPPACLLLPQKSIGGSGSSGDSSDTLWSRRAAEAAAAAAAAATRCGLGFACAPSIPLACPLLPRKDNLLCARFARALHLVVFVLASHAPPPSLSLARSRRGKTDLLCAGFARALAFLAPHPPTRLPAPAADRQTFFALASLARSTLKSSALPPRRRRTHRTWPFLPSCVRLVLPCNLCIPPGCACGCNGE
jgi:hypothetical protein